ncbi:MAG: hypothetical protein V4603_07380 [Pseudomonadota bacterium]
MTISKPSLSLFSRWFFLQFVGLCAGVASVSPAASAQWFGDAALEAVSTDNVSRSPLTAHADDDQSLQLSARGGRYLQLADYTGLELQATLARQQSHHFSGLSNTRAGATAMLSHKFGLGDRVPVLSVTTGVERSRYNEDLRDAWTWTTVLGYRQRLTDRLQANLSAGYEQQDGDHNMIKPVVAPAVPKSGSVWDVNALTLDVGAEWDLGPSSWLAASLGYRDGDTVASVLPYPFILSEATAVTVDPAFAPGVVAYRLDASTRSFAVDWNLALFDTATFYIGVERQFTRSDRALDYRTGILRTGLLYSF